MLRFTLRLLLHFSITTECYVIIHVFKFLFFVNLSQSILSDFQSYLLSILKSFNNHISPLVFEIKPIIYQLKIALKTVNFLWTPSYLCILGNEPTHNLATFLSGFSSCIVDLQFLFMTSNTFQNFSWSFLSLNCATWHRLISPFIHCYPGFKGLQTFPDSLLYILHDYILVKTFFSIIFVFLSILHSSAPLIFFKFV